MSGTESSGRSTVESTMYRKHTYLHGTWIESGDFVGNSAARVLCTDGKIRQVAHIAASADTFFSTPAAVRVKGKYVRGYVTSRDDTLIFYRYDYGKHADMLPPWFTGELAESFISLP